MTTETVLFYLGYASGPLIGAIIGIFTNYIAVKMLFRPYLPKKLFGMRVPFTPGIIPKRRGALAHAIGKAVGEELFTGDDIKNILCSEAVEKRIFDAISESVCNASHSSAQELALSLTNEVELASLKERLSLFLADKIVSALKGMGLGDIIAEQGRNAIAEKKASLGILGAFLSDDLINPLLSKVSEGVTSFLDERGIDTALVAVRSEVETVSSLPVCELFDTSKIDTSRLFYAFKPIYEEAVARAIECATDALDVCSVVESKINQMDIRELEALCLRIMKKELNAVIYLGGVIGLLLGVINIFI